MPTCLRRVAGIGPAWRAHFEGLIIVSKAWVFVSGGSRGIGAGVVKALVDANYSVAFTYVASDDAARALEDALGNEDNWCRGYKCDMGNQESVDQLAAELQAVHGAPYAIINNVGITRDALMLHMSAQHWGEVIRNNLDSAYYATRAFTAGMIERGDGCIVNMSSVTGIKGNPGQANYAATKAALIGMTRSLAVELGRFNIRVNSVAPGIIATEMTASLTDQQVRKIASQVPLRRLGRVDEIAATVTFLLSRGSCYTTGQTFVVDGGLSA